MTTTTVTVNNAAVTAITGRYKNTMSKTQLIERFRKALMQAHSHDWTMEVISEAAHICAEVANPTPKLMRNDTPEKARQRYRNNGFGVYGSPSAKKTFDKYMQLFEAEAS